MKKWVKKFEDAMAAAAFAEEGEFEAAKEVLREQRKILLVVTGKNADVNALKYAVSMCKRIGAQLEIMFARGSKENVLCPFKEKLEGEEITYRFIPVEECIKEEVLHYTSRRPDILFVVLESEDGLHLKCKKTARNIEMSWKNLKCPLVVVSDLATA